MLAPRPTPKLEDHPLSAVRDFIQFIRSYPPYRRPFLYPQPEDGPCRGDRDPLTQNRTWENIKENIQTSAKESLGLRELKQNKPWFDEECLGFLDQRKRAKMQWMQDPSQTNVDILNNVRREVSRHFRDKKKAYLRAKIKELETNSKIQNIRDLYRGIID